MLEKIGINAGKIWEALNEKGPTEIKILRKTLKITEKEMYAALGWLAREEKVDLTVKGKETFISLV